MKAIHLILGIGTALVLWGLIDLGIRAFYPSPVSPDYSMHESKEYATQVKVPMRK